MSRFSSPENTSMRSATGKTILDRLIVPMDRPVQSLGPAQHWPLSLKTALSVIFYAKNAMFLFWGQDMVCFYNDACLPHLSEEQQRRPILGTPLREAFPDQWPFLMPLFLKLRDEGKAILDEEPARQLFKTAPSGSPLHSSCYSCLESDDGEVPGILVSAQERYSTQHQADPDYPDCKKNAADQALEGANLGYWSVRIPGEEISLSDRFLEILGFSTSYLPDGQELLSLIHPEYAGKVKATFIRALTSSQPLTLEFPITLPGSAETKWVSLRGKLYFNHLAQPAYLTGTLDDITERKTDEFRKNDFIRMVSHELKTPLTSVSAYLQLLQEKSGKSSDSFSDSLFTKAGTQVKKMTAMINGFLNMSHPDPGKIQINKQYFNLDDLIKEIISETEVTVSSHKIHFELRGNVKVRADRDKIASVIANLISNAVKYSPCGSIIDIKCRVSCHCAEVSVTDQGAGIALADRDRLFERYYRIQNQHTQDIPGFGIGLYLCAEIIRLHEGRIWVDSEVSSGSSFHFMLPLPLPNHPDRPL